METYRLHTIIRACWSHSGTRWSVSIYLDVYYHPVVYSLASAGHRDMLLQRGYLHRNVSLSNIILDPHGGDKNFGRLIDFDLAKRVEFGSKTSTEGDFRMVSVDFQSSLFAVVVADRRLGLFPSGDTHVPVLQGAVRASPRCAAPRLHGRPGIVFLRLVPRDVLVRRRPFHSTNF